MTLGRLSLAIAAVLSVLLVGPAAARAEDPPPPEGIGTAEDPGFAEENEENDRPNDPDAETTKLDGEDASATKKARPTKATYPLEVTQRPLTLARSQAEVSLDVIFMAIPADGRVATQVLRGSYGVTQDLQIGVTYGFGAERLSPPDGAKGFEPGKAMSIDGAYTIVPDVFAVTLSLPIYFDPFAVSATLGAPFRLRGGKKLTIVGGYDLLRIRMNRWPIDVANPEYNLGQLAGDAVGVPFDRGQINVNVAAQVQLKPNLMIFGEAGLHFPDFGDADRPVSGFFGLVWSKNKTFDVGARMGLPRMDEGKSFTMAVTAAYRL